MSFGQHFPFQPIDAPNPAAPVAPTVQRIAPVRSPTWAVSLVFCCLVIGILAAWIRGEVSLRRIAQSRTNVLTDAISAQDSREEDIGLLMSDSRTQFVRLIGTETSAVHQASLAWNEPRQSGVVFSDKLPPLKTGIDYEVFAVSDGGVSHAIAKFDAQPGKSVYPFKSSDPISHVSSFEIRTGSDGAPILHGDLAH